MRRLEGRASGELEDAGYGVTLVRADPAAGREGRRDRAAQDHRS